LYRRERDKNVSDRVKRLSRLLLRFYDETTGCCDKDEDFLAYELGWSRSKVQRVMTELRELEWIRTRRRRGTLVITFPGLKKMQMMRHPRREDASSTTKMRHPRPEDASIGDASSKKDLSFFSTERLSRGKESPAPSPMHVEQVLAPKARAKQAARPIDEPMDAQEAREIERDRRRHERRLAREREIHDLWDKQAKERREQREQESDDDWDPANGPKPKGVWGRDWQ
jgi:DNA-binding transcriptional MocR family regulator